MLVYECSPPPLTEQVTVTNCLKVLPPLPSQRIPRIKEIQSIPRGVAGDN